jgi:double-stranded uracil-DNA glycosylase
MSPTMPPAERSFSFPPVARADAVVLILGTLPGQASLEAQQYYAQPQNAFWPLMGALLGAGRELPYPERLRRLMENRVALWDVCASAYRPGSLDQKIDDASVVPNDFAAFFGRHEGVERICFNGATAERLFKRHVAPTLTTRAATVRLPSTSPAHAGRSFAQKREAWAAALADLLSPEIHIL